MDKAVSLIRSREASDIVDGWRGPLTINHIQGRMSHCVLLDSRGITHAVYTPCVGKVYRRQVGIQGRVISEEKWSNL
jgi:hypothetical protein